MKRKFLPSHKKSRLIWHTLIFVVSMVALWLIVPSMTYRPDEPGVLVNYKQHTVNLFYITILWTLVLTAHFGLYRLSYLAQQRAQKIFTSHAEDPYQASTHLEINAFSEKDTLTHQTDWIAAQRLQSK
jgi:hypothetical protein